MEVSPVRQENSPFREEIAPMSAIADVSEMQGICAEIVRLLPVGLQKQQVPELARKIGVTENRALEFLRAKARRVDSWEKDVARRLRDDLRRAEQRRREHEHLTWLQEQMAGMDGGGVDALQHLLRRGGYEAGAVAVPEAFDPADDDQSRNWR